MVRFATRKFVPFERAPLEQVSCNQRGVSRSGQLDALAAPVATNREVKVTAPVVDRFDSLQMQRRRWIALQ